MTPITLRVQELREAKALSQSELSRLSGVRQATISEIEAGKTRRIAFDVLERLADALAVDPAVLVVRTRAKRRVK